MADTTDLNQDFYSRLQALMAASAAAGHPLGVESGYRTTAEQASLYNQYGPGRAAFPGTSMHEKGLAVDLSGDSSWAHQHAAEFGLYFPMSWEPWHIQPLGVGGGHVPGQSARPGVPTDVLSDPRAARQRIIDALNQVGEMMKAPTDQQSQQVVAAPTDTDTTVAATTKANPVVTATTEQPTQAPPVPVTTAAPRQPAQGGGGATPGQGPGGDLKAQLKAGFEAAGRKDLAGMVDTQAFDLWINKESSWNPGVVSAANNQGMPNGGLFQFWYGHDWAKQYFQGGKFTASPYQQAYLAATQFNLTPQKIQNYANQINSGSYVGWG